MREPFFLAKATSSFSCCRVAAAPVGLLGEQKKIMSVLPTCTAGHWLRHQQRLPADWLHSPHLAEVREEVVPGLAAHVFNVVKVAAALVVAPSHAHDDRRVHIHRIRGVLHSHRVVAAKHHLQQRHRQSAVPDPGWTTGSPQFVPEACQCRTWSHLKQRSRRACGPPEHTTCCRWLPAAGASPAQHHTCRTCSALGLCAPPGAPQNALRPSPAVPFPGGHASRCRCHCLRNAGRDGLSGVPNAQADDLGIRVLFLMSAPPPSDLHAWPASLLARANPAQHTGNPPLGTDSQLGACQSCGFAGLKWLQPMDGIVMSVSAKLHEATACTYPAQQASLRQQLHRKLFPIVSCRAGPSAADCSQVTGLCKNSYLERILHEQTGTNKRPWSCSMAADRREGLKGI